MNKKIITELLNSNVWIKTNEKEIDENGDEINHTYYDFHILDGYKYTPFSLCRRINYKKIETIWEIISNPDLQHEDYLIALENNPEYTFDNWKEEYKEILITKDYMKFELIKKILNENINIEFKENKIELNTNSKTTILSDENKNIKIELPYDDEDYKTSIRVNKVIINEFRNFCEIHNNFTQKELLSMALLEYMEKYKNSNDKYIKKTIEYDNPKLELLLENIDSLLKLIPKENSIYKSNIITIKTLRVDEGLYEELRKRAELNNNTISELLNNAIENYLDTF